MESSVPHKFVTSKFVKTHVTCIKFIENTLLAGIGDTLHIFVKEALSSSWLCLQAQQIFTGHNIYGIVKGDDENVIIFSGRKVCFLSLTRGSAIRIDVSYYFDVKDWILDCTWHRDLIFLTANNALLSYKLSPVRAELLETSVCSQRCILYSGKVYTNQEDVVVLAGTVFSTIIIWRNSCLKTPKPVIHSLTGHKGVIFSVTYCDKTHRICSTSDDRTVRVWNVEFKNSQFKDWTDCGISLKFTLYGHSARVWSHAFLLSGQVVSVGEDSRICLWNNQGDLENQWFGHQSGEIWSLDVSDQLKCIATGGSDGGISLWPISRSPAPVLLPFSGEMQSAEKSPRCVGLLFSGKAFMVNCDGEIFLRGENWKLCCVDSSLKSYCLHAVSPDRQFFALGNLFGKVSFYHKKNDTIEKILETNTHEGRIYSLIWLNANVIAVCGPEGNFALWKFYPELRSLKRESYFTLPPCKERWITSCAADDEYVVCGDRIGSIYLYRRNSKTPISVLKKCHGVKGTTDIKLANGKILSTGRDGKYRELIIQNDELVVLRACKLKLDWLAGILDTESMGRILICFHDVFFLLWNVEERRNILKIDCGGGHRSWDCHIDCSSKEISLTYIKGKSVHFCNISFEEILSETLVSGCHAKSINAAALIPYGKSKDTILSKNLSQNHHALLGGEDTTLRLVSFANDRQHETTVLQSHLSSIRAVTCLASQLKDEIFVASGGGRGQLVLWKIFQPKGFSTFEVVEQASYCIIETVKSTTINDLAEMRIMDLQMFQASQDIVVVVSGCSDGFLRLFEYNTNINTVKLVQQVDLGQCLLKVMLIDWDQHLHLVQCGTRGTLHFNPLTESRLMENDRFELSVSECGVNSCDYVKQNQNLIISTAGDDACVNIIVLFREQNSWKQLKQWKNNSAHTCQISGMKLTKNWLFTAGLDQMLSIFEWRFSSSELSVTLFTSVKLCVPDIHGLLAWQNDEVYQIYVCGLGCQLLTFSPPKLC